MHSLGKTQRFLIVPMLFGLAVARPMPAAATLPANTPPVARIVAPLDGSFFAAGDEVVLRGSGTDAEDQPASLRYAWSVTLHHNDHFHPDIYTSSAPVDSFQAQHHDDDTGISLIIRLVVTDSGGATDSASVVIYPEVDLQPTPIVTSLLNPNCAITQYAFWVANRGRMPAPTSHWRLAADSTVIAEGDTLVAARDSVQIVGTLPPLPPGTKTLTAVVDALHQVYETNENNNLTQRVWGAPPFPSARVLDGFDRADGPVGSPWVGSVSGLGLRNYALVQTAVTSYAVWNGGAFGPDQEAFVRFDSVTAASPEQDLLLKVQGTTWTTGTISVAYAANGSSVSVYTYSPAAGWVRRGVPWGGVRFGLGDQFGARASANGTITVYRNGVAIGSASVAAWEFASAGGRVGLLLRSANQTRLVDFGGGNVTDAPATAPHASILAPLDGSIQVPGDSVAVRGAGSDAEDAAGDLRFRWRIALPGGAVTQLGAAGSFVMPATSAGSIPIRLIVTDRTGRCDTAFVAVRADTGTLDRFDRADGPPGAPWGGMTSVFAIRNHALVETGTSGYLMWNGTTFGTNQEAWIVLDSLTATAPEHDLLLKSQGPSWSAGVIQVAYSASQSQVTVNTYTPGVGWARCAGPWRGIVLVPGDRFGARALADGRVQVFRNGVLLAEGSAAAWPYAGNGGRIGLILTGATRTRISRFGGGTLASASPEPAVPVDSVEHPPAPGGSAAAVIQTRVSRAVPNPVRRDVTFTLELPREARIGLVVFDLLGRLVWSDPERSIAAGRTALRWSGLDHRGAPAGIGAYVARVTIDGRPFVRRFTILR